MRYGQSPYYTSPAATKNEEAITQRFFDMINAKWRKGVIDVVEATRQMRAAGAFEAEITEAFGRV